MVISPTVLQMGSSQIQLGLMQAAGEESSSVDSKRISVIGQATEPARKLGGRLRLAQTIKPIICTQNYSLVYSCVVCYHLVLLSSQSFSSLWLLYQISLQGSGTCRPRL